jgi:hypothetical protein
MTGFPRFGDRKGFILPSTEASRTRETAVSTKETDGVDEGVEGAARKARRTGE